MRAFKSLLTSALCVLALGVWAASAQAIVAEWMIESSTLAELGSAEKEISLSGGPLTLSAPSLGLTVECKKVANNGAILKGGSEELKASMTECQVVKVPTCKVTEPLLVEAKSELILVGESRYDKLVPLKAEKPFATITLKGTECSLAEKTELKGSVAAEPSFAEQVSQPLQMSELISKTVNEGLSKEKAAELSLKLGAASASLSGTISTALAGADAGKEWVKDPLTRLCKVQLATCTEVQTIKKGSTIKAESEISTKFKYEKEHVPVSATCTTSTFEGITAVESGAPLSGVFTTATFGCGACTASFEAGIMPLVFKFWATNNGNGNLALWGTGGMVEIKVVCNGITCVYGTRGLLFTAAGGTPAKFSRLTAVQLTLRGGSSGECSGNATWEGSAAVPLKYKFTTPGTMFVTG